MSRLLICFIVALVSFSTLAEHHGSADAEVRDAVKAFNSAYASNDAEAYFSHYADDATLHFFGARQKLRNARSARRPD